MLRASRMVSQEANEGEGSNERALVDTEYESQVNLTRPRYHPPPGPQTR